MPENDTKTEDLSKKSTKDLLMVLDQGLIKRPAVLSQLALALVELEGRFKNGSASDMPATDHNTRKQLAQYAERLLRSLSAARAQVTTMTFVAAQLRDHLK